MHADEFLIRVIHTGSFLCTLNIDFSYISHSVPVMPTALEKMMSNL